MHVQLATALVIVALISSVLLVLNRGDKMFPVVAIIASGIVALIAFGIIELSVSKFRIDVILPAVITLAGGVCWMRATDKTTISAAVALSLAGLTMVCSALGVVG
jgi:hypothetical protein